MKILCRMNAAGEHANPLLWLIGLSDLPTAWNGSSLSRSLRCVHTGTGSPWHVHACSTAAATAASQTVWLFDGSAGVSQTVVSVTPKLAIPRARLTLRILARDPR